MVECDEAMELGGEIPWHKLTWMMHKSALSVGLLDFVLVGSFIHTKDLVVVLPLALLQLQLGML